MSFVLQHVVARRSTTQSKFAVMENCTIEVSPKNTCAVEPKHTTTTRRSAVPGIYNLKALASTAVGPRRMIIISRSVVRANWKTWVIPRKATAAVRKPTASRNRSAVLENFRPKVPAGTVVNQKRSTSARRSAARVNYMIGVTPRRVTAVVHTHTT